jgi:hypothetical protein
MNITTTKPRIVAFEVTRKCRFNCIHCRAAASKTEANEYLTTNQCKRFLLSLAEYNKCVIILTETKFPHAGHVLLSTWASLFHIIMAKGQVVSLLSYAVIFLFLFLAVWLPCCLSDIVFPLGFVKEPHLENK